MSQRVIHAGHICPECDNGFVPDGECVACAGTGWIGREVIYVRDGWLRLPDGSYLNGQYITAVTTAWTTDDEAEVVPIGLVIRMTDGSHHSVYAEDVAAVTAWLEGRS